MHHWSTRVRIVTPVIQASLQKNNNHICVLKKQMYKRQSCVFIYSVVLRPAGAWCVTPVSEREQADVSLRDRNSLAGGGIRLGLGAVQGGTAGTPGQRPCRRCWTIQWFCGLSMSVKRIMKASQSSTCFGMGMMVVDLKRMETMWRLNISLWILLPVGGCRAFGTWAWGQTWQMFVISCFAADGFWSTVRSWCTVCCMLFLWSGMGIPHIM